MFVQIESDKSFHKKLTAEAFPTDDGTAVNGIKSDQALDVQTAILYIFYKGTWYPQNISPFA